MAKAKLTPKIDYTKEDVVLLTPAGVQHNYKETQSKNYVLVENNAGGGFCVSFYDDYFAINSYQVRGFTWSVESYMRNKNAILVTKYIKQIRIYKDRKIAMIMRDEETESGKCYVNSTGTLVDMNDEAIRSKASTIRGRMKNDFCNYTRTEKEFALKNPTIEYTGYYSQGLLLSNTQEKIKKFFDISGENKPLMDFYKSKNGNDKISCIENLLLFLTVSLKTEETKKKKSETIQEFADYFKSSISSEDDQQTIYWARIEENVAVLSKHARYYRNPAIFIYNTKTKKRTLAMQNTSTGIWESVIPSLQTISTHFQAIYYGTNEAGNYTELKSPCKILGGVTWKELFAGTNMEWILDNVTDDELLISIRNTVPIANMSESEENVRPIKQWFSNDYVPPFAIAILATTGDHVLELLLKAKLFNLYLVKLGENPNDKVFGDLDGKKCTYYEDFLYHSKAQNLQSMFNISLNLLRILDKSMDMKLEEQERSMYNHLERRVEKKVVSYYRRQILSLYKIADIYDMDKMDKTMFQEIIQASTKHSKRRNENLLEVKNKLGITGNRQIMDVAKKYYGDCGDYSFYVDYLNARESLRKLQQAKLKKYLEEGRDDPVELLQIKEIFSEKTYPAKPEKARRFFNIVGTSDNDYHPYDYTNGVSWIGLEEDEGTHYGVLNWNTYKYSKFLKEGKHELIRDEKDRPEGLVVWMSPADNMIFLHDITAKIVQLLSDESKQAMFEEAMERVKPLEWEDPELGLKIIVPGTVKALNREGAILRHCVASYADSIIHGSENIMFLRRMDMPDAPFFTVEILSDGQIRQVHCFQNGSLTAAAQGQAFTDSRYECYNRVFDIVKFLKRWAAAMNGKVKALTIKEQYGALCALRY